ATEVCVCRALKVEVLFGVAVAVLVNVAVGVIAQAQRLLPPFFQESLASPYRLFGVRSVMIAPKTKSTWKLQLGATVVTMRCVDDWVALNRPVSPVRDLYTC